MGWRLKLALLAGSRLKLSLPAGSRLKLSISPNEEAALVLKPAVVSLVPVSAARPAGWSPRREEGGNGNTDEPRGSRPDWERGEITSVGTHWHLQPGLHQEHDCLHFTGFYCYIRITTVT